MDDLVREGTRERLLFLQALVDAQDRRSEVMSIVASSEDPAEAARRLATLLGLADATVAHVVLDMQVRRWTRRERLRILADRDEARDALDDS